MNLPDYYARRIGELDAQVAMREAEGAHFRRIQTGELRVKLTENKTVGRGFIDPVRQPKKRGTPAKNVPAYRILELRKKGHTMEKVASILGCSVATAYCRLQADKREQSAPEIDEAS